MTRGTHRPTRTSPRFPYTTLFQSWNSAMNVPVTIRMLTDKDETTGEYRIPKIIYSDAFYSETVPYADLVLPDTTYLERWDCISLLDRPLSNAHDPVTPIRQTVVHLDLDVRPLRARGNATAYRLGLPAAPNEH